MSMLHAIELEFDAELNRHEGGKELRDGLSVALQVGSSLWVANDETITLERLTLTKDAAGRVARAAEHRQFSLADYLRLPVPPSSDPASVEEADIEGLACANGYLWLTGSHSLKRRKPKSLDRPDKALKQLARIGSDGNRYLLARIPLVESAGLASLADGCMRDGRRLRAARLHGNDKGNVLTEALRQDEHLAPFLFIPGKDNGFDIEGLAAAGERLFLGLRGPVLRGWAVVLEIAPEEDPDEPACLRLRAISPDGRSYRKHFLDLDGLGVRDLCAQGPDLLILAGPTMDLDGPVRVYRWRDGLAADGESIVPAAALERILDVPYGQRDDHAEGITLLVDEDGKADALLVVYDSAASSRRSGASTVTADVFRLP